MIHPLITHHLSHNISSLSSLSSIISLTGGHNQSADSHNTPSHNTSSLSSLSPHLILPGGHNQSADAWALGVLFHELLIGRTPFMTEMSKQRSQRGSFGGGRGPRAAKKAVHSESYVLSAIADVQVKGFHLSRPVSLALLDIDGCLDLLLGLLAAVPASR